VKSDRVHVIFHIVLSDHIDTELSSVFIVIVASAGNDLPICFLFALRRLISLIIGIYQLLSPISDIFKIRYFLAIRFLWISSEWNVHPHVSVE